MGSFHQLQEIEKTLIGSGLGFDAGADEPGVSMYQRRLGQISPKCLKALFATEERGSMSLPVFIFFTQKAAELRCIL